MQIKKCNLFYGKISWVTPNIVVFVFCVIRKLSEDNMLIFTTYWILILAMILQIFFSREDIFKPHWVCILGAYVVFSNIIS